MKRINLLFATLLLLIVTTSSFNDGKSGATVGKTAPDIEFENTRLSKMRGKYVLLSIWSAGDAESRRLCAQYDAMLARPGFAGIDFVGVNLGDESALFDGIVKADGLDAGRQHRLEAEKAAKLCRDFKIEAGHAGTLLIGRDGRVEAVNPTARQLAAIAG